MGYLISIYHKNDFLWYATIAYQLPIYVTAKIAVTKALSISEMLGSSSILVNYADFASIIFL
ncbi:hypothetical protein, partial [Sphingobacterium multivorum]|uniref:hypothetical protein n=1 Tax=Sphingobacterium multivorum TaxID=28454 RepID=UPI0028AE8DAE